MIQHIKAIYEHGVLRPLSPIELGDEEIVSITVERDDDAQTDDSDYDPLIAEEGDSSVTWEEVRAALAKLPGSLAQDCINEGDERF